MKNLFVGTNRNPLSIEQLKGLSEGEWVWIEVLIPFSYEHKISAYYKKQYDYSHGRAFCCGYPGLSFGFNYIDYEKTWVAYRTQPEKKEK